MVLAFGRSGDCFGRGARAGILSLPPTRQAKVSVASANNTLYELRSIDMRLVGIADIPGVQTLAERFIGLSNAKFDRQSLDEADARQPCT